MTSSSALATLGAGDDDLGVSEGDEKDARESVGVAEPLPSGRVVQ